MPQMGSIPVSHWESHLMKRTTSTFWNKAGLPAAMPMDEWLDLQQKEQRQEEEESLVSSGEQQHDNNNKEDPQPKEPQPLATWKFVLGPRCQLAQFWSTLYSWHLYNSTNQSTMGPVSSSMLVLCIVTKYYSTVC
jgi:hypothetical protein